MSHQPFDGFGMMLRQLPFKFILPVLYLISVALFVGGIIFTIAEGPNPFGLLFYVALYPSTLIFDLLLPHSPLWANMNGWGLLLLAVSTNLVIYFFIGYLIRSTNSPARHASNRRGFLKSFCDGQTASPR
jgi:hypothetical protein